MKRQDASTGQVVDVPCGTAGNDGLMHVRVYSPFRIFFDEPAKSISAGNAEGPFDILPQHHNFITLLSACELNVVRPGGSEQRIRITGGVMHVKADRVTVFLDV